jgi:hypothetical protein
LIPNQKTVAAIKEARRGKLVIAGMPANLLPSLNKAVKYTSRFKRGVGR